MTTIGVRAGELTFASGGDGRHVALAHSASRFCPRVVDVADARRVVAMVRRSRHKVRSSKTVTVPIIDMIYHHSFVSKSLHHQLQDTIWSGMTLNCQVQK